jgi:hypothetical protein
MVDWLEVLAETRRSSTTLGRVSGSRLSKPVSTRSRVARTMEMAVSPASTPEQQEGMAELPAHEAVQRPSQQGTHHHSVPSGGQAHR